MQTSKSKPSIYGAGLVALDLVVSAEQGSPINAWAGGTCGNVIAILSYLGWDAYPITSLGMDPASHRLKDDLLRWGVHLDLSSCDLQNSTPIIVQEIYQCDAGAPRHRFAWECPSCGYDLPKYKSISADHVRQISQNMMAPDVFFVDRLSPSTISLARLASERGAVVVYEPSVTPAAGNLAEILSIAHIVKYSNERLSELGVSTEGSSIRLEIQTLGKDGLRYRYNKRGSGNQWTFVSAFDVPRVTDSCGSGDWCTAGILSKVGAGGHRAFKSLSADSVCEALSYGQALASWNCGFEGARGGMYSETIDTFSSQIRAIVSGQKHVRNHHSHSRNSYSFGSIPCPSCDCSDIKGSRT